MHCRTTEPVPSQEAFYFISWANIRNKILKNNKNVIVINVKSIHDILMP